MKTTVVFPLHDGGGRFRNDTELLYTLRSWEKYFNGEMEVVIVGMKLPQWMDPTKVTHLPARGLKTALRVAADAYPEGFVWTYDDCVLVANTDEATVKVTPCNEQWGGTGTSWEKKLNSIRARLEANKMISRDYSKPHGPYWFDKSMVDEGFEDWPRMAAKFPWETWILCKRNWPYVTNVVKKYYSKFNGPPAAHVRYVNYCDGGVTVELLNWLASLFPNPSGFEKENMLDADTTPIVKKAVSTGIVLTHGGAQKITERHLSNWLNFFDSIEFVCPENDPVEIPGRMVHLCGVSCRSGKDSCERMRFACQLAATKDTAIVLEYDTLIFDRIAPSDTGKIIGSVKFQACIHSPWVSNQKDWERLASVPIDIEPTKAPDCWLFTAIARLGFCAEGMKFGYSRNTLVKEEEILEACNAVRRGTAAIHGVKSVDVFQRLTAAYTERKSPPKLPMSAPATIAKSSPNALSFCLYGLSAHYSAGMCMNVDLARKIYPGWDVVVHVSQGHYAIDRLRLLGARVIEHPIEPEHKGMMWRFATAEAGGYDAVVFRDADSRLNAREKAAVDAWLAGGLPLHVMRDHKQHRKPIMGGAWGLRSGSLDVAAMAQDWPASGKYGDDEEFLAKRVWPVLKDKACVHVGNGAGGNSELAGQPFPEHAPVIGHVGERMSLLMPGNTRYVLLSPEHYAGRRERFYKKLTETEGFLKKVDVEWWKATPHDKCYAPPSFAVVRRKRHWWAATCDHLRIMEETIVGGYDHLFLFEDDASFIREFSELFWRAWAGLPANWKAMRLGWHTRPDWPTPAIHPGVLNRCATSGGLMIANLWNRDGLIRAYDHFWHRRKMIIDIAFADLRQREPRDWYQPATMLVTKDLRAKQRGCDC